MDEQQISEQIQIWLKQRNEQRYEVAAKFAGEARSLLRDGKAELAKRKMKAAVNIATGSHGED